MQYIPFILPHLKQKVWADSFLYEVTRNNKLLVSNEELVTKIIYSALDSCNALDMNVFGEAILISEGNKNEDRHLHKNDFEKSRIFFSLRGILLYNEQGFKRNQEILMNAIQYSKYCSLIFKKKT